MAIIQTYELLEKLRQQIANIDLSKKLHLVLIGPPGCGKGTHAKWLYKKYNLIHYSTGDALREMLKKNVDDPEIKAISAGAYVSDNLMNKMISEVVINNKNAKGILFDGYPRTIAQAEALDKILQENGDLVTCALYFKTDDKTVIERASGRRIHPSSGRTYHIKNYPPKVEGKDDITGEDLILRDDDKEEIIAKRLHTYSVLTEPILNYYNKKNKLITLNGNEEFPYVHRDIEQLFEIANVCNKIVQNYTFIS